MKKLCLIPILTLFAGFFSLQAQDQTDRIPADDERRLTQDTVMDDPIRADTAMMEDGKIIEERLKGDTSSLNNSNQDAIPNEEKIKKDKKDRVK
jgi:hypothetical protein